MNNYQNYQQQQQGALKQIKCPACNGGLSAGTSCPLCYGEGVVMISESGALSATVSASYKNAQLIAAQQNRL